MVADKGCPDTLELLAYVNGSLAEFEAERVSRHIEGQDIEGRNSESKCRRCAEDLRFLRAIHATQEVEFVSPPPWVEAKAAAIPRLGAEEPETVFDSELEVFAAAARSAGLLEHKLVWRVRDFYVEIDVEREDASCAITGRICGGAGPPDLSGLRAVFAGTQGTTEAKIGEDGAFHATTPATKQEFRLFRGARRIFASALKP